MTAIKLGEPSLEVRPVTCADIDAVLDVYRRCEDFLALGPVATASMAMVLRDIEGARHDGGIFCGIFNSENTMIGVVEYIPSPFEGDRHCACLSLLLLARDHRNRGIGRAVLNAVEAELRRDAEVTGIVAGVQVNNPRALAFWQRQGFRVVSGPEVRHDHTTVLRLRKDFPSR